MSLIRYLAGSEIPLLRDHLLRLDPEDRRMRFGGASLKPEAVEAYCASIDRSRSLHVGCFDQGVLRGVAQICFLDGPVPGWLDHAGNAEFAISVERPWQNGGIGTRLPTRAVILARNRNIANLFMMCLPDNDKMKRLARKCGIRLRSQDGEVIGAAGLDRPDALTVVAEYVDSAAGLVDELLEYAAR
jgi:GNAT superfamily N-acetyltransferase